VYTINQLTTANSTTLVLESSSKSAKAVISLQEGARISELMLDSNTIIQELPNFSYSDSYAAAILFPFVSRIESGHYEFEGKDYQLECNQAGVNALHGLVYNKTFSLVQKEVLGEGAFVTLAYTETNPPKGFPFKYYIELTYLLFENSLDIRIKATNLDTVSFPFTLGWHPYFYTNHLEDCVVKFNSHQQVAFDEKLITKALIPFENTEDFAIKNKQLDDCFVMNDDLIQFITPTYQLAITSDTTQNYLQMYTPPHKTLIAIEPMTGISNSFNNKIGLQVLAPQQSFEITWKLAIH
jgi:aldose 1-epimerase